MGLDMYLYNKKDDHDDDWYDNQLAYWRKANQIHGWIVRECGDGIDECQKIDFPVPKMIELRDLCRKALAGDTSIANNQLVPTQGFFFGGYEIDEWYWQSIQETFDQLDKVLKEANEGDEFIYQASW